MAAEIEFFDDDCDDFGNPKAEPLRIAVKFLKARDAMRTRLGSKYRDYTSDVGSRLRELASTLGCEILEVALGSARRAEVRGHTEAALLILAAAVEMIDAGEGGCRG